LRIPDLFKLFYFVVVYPFCVLRLACSIDVSDYGRYLLRYELLDTISEVTFYNFSRYLQGKRIASLPCPKVKLISWYENLPLHKNLYAGIKKNHNNKAQIYGAQLFLFTESFPYVMPDENERPFGVVPDKILVNGPYYLPPRPLFNYAPGPSLRYARLFQTPVQKREQKNILVLLPYYEQDILNILDLLGKVEQNAWCEKLMIKFHPTIKKAKFINKVPVSSRIVDDDIYKLFQTTQIVIGAASGTPIEAASLGIPVIVVRNPARFEYNNTLPSLGKGIIWEEVEGAEELIRQIQKFKVNLEADAGQIVSIAARYKNMFFSEPLPENITRAFDLSDA
jgi:hypothetical protein